MASYDMCMVLAHLWAVRIPAVDRLLRLLQVGLPVARQTVRRLPVRDAEIEDLKTESMVCTGTLESSTSSWLCNATSCCKGKRHDLRLSGIESTSRHGKRVNVTLALRRSLANMSLSIGSGAGRPSPCSSHSSRHSPAL